VESIAEWNPLLAPLWTPPQGTVAVADPNGAARVGGTYAGGAFGPAPVVARVARAGPVRLARKIPGRFYPPDTLTFAATTAPLAAGTLYALPMSLALSLDALAVEVTTALANQNIRAGIYGSDENGLPGDLLMDCGLQSTSPAGTKIFPCVRRSAEPIFLALIASGAVTVRTGAASNRISQIIGHTALGSVPNHTGFTRAVPFGPLPDVFGAATPAAVNFMIAARGG
jgi:hypothetical protein